MINLALLLLLAASSEADIRRTLTDQTEAWNRGDLVRFVETYLDSPETTFIGSAVTHGRAQLLARYRTRYSTPAKMGQLTFSDLEIHPLGKKYSTVIGRFHLKRTDSSTGPDTGIFSLILVNTTKGWKIIQDHTS